MSDPETLAYILLKSLYVGGIVCGLTPPLLLIAVLLDEWRCAKKAHAVKTLSQIPAMQRSTRIVITVQLRTQFNRASFAAFVSVLPEWLADLTLLWLAAGPGLLRPHDLYTWGLV